MKSLFKNIVILLISFLDPLVSKKSEYVIYNSYPDLSDNSFALFLYTLEHYPKKRNIWLLKSMSVKQATRNIKVYSDKTNFKFVKRDSLQGAWYYLRSKYVFFTHGLYAGSEISKHHVVVNLWHGMPLKNIGLMDKNTINQKSSHTIASSLFYQQIMSQSLGLTLNQVLVVGQPRIDLLYQGVSSVEKLGICMFNYQKMILWTPTYRQSIVGDLRYDGKITDHLPLMGKNKLSELDLILQSMDSVLIIKLHPMDMLNDKEFKSYKNIKILKNKDLELMGVQLYALMSEADVLLTDFSSIYLDFLYLNRPIGFIFDDLESYSNSRGFVFDKPLKYMPGAVISNFEEFHFFLETVIKKNLDDYSEDRIAVHHKMNVNHKNYSRQLLNAIDFH